MSENIVEAKQARNLFNFLIRDKNRVLCSANEIIKNLIKEIKKSADEKDQPFCLFK